LRSSLPQFLARGKAKTKLRSITAHNQEEREPCGRSKAELRVIVVTLTVTDEAFVALTIKLAGITEHVEPVGTPRMTVDAQHRSRPSEVSPCREW
jgi:hypothetical protein